MDPAAPATMTARSLGARIKSAREALGMSQEALSNAMGIADRQTLSDIERGARTVRPDELVRFGELLQRDIEFFIDPFVVEGEAMFSWRAVDSLPGAELDRFESHVGAWIGMLRFLRRWDPDVGGPFGQTLRLDRNASFEEALSTGEAVAQRLRLGAVPAKGLVDKIESILDVPVLFVDAVTAPHGSVSGATCHLPDLGVILINRNEPEARRNYDIAHELFHVLTWSQMPPERREDRAPKPKSKEWRVERLADNFAAGLLVPTDSLDRFIRRTRSTDVDHLVDVANELRVSPGALAYRLFNAKRIDERVRDELLQRKSGLAPTVPKRFSTRFVELAYNGIDRGHVSSRKVAKTLGMTLPQLAELFTEYTNKPVPFAL
jgi:Zn-dependent peptidase ImmA (M78 family)/transcriptional regulator with XRE-family HTH domain